MGQVLRIYIHLGGGGRDWAEEEAKLGCLVSTETSADPSHSKLWAGKAPPSCSSLRPGDLALKNQAFGCGRIQGGAPHWGQAAPSS